MKKLILTIVTTFLYAGCGQVNLDNPGQRFISSTISCETGAQCFSRIDSLLWQREELEFSTMKWQELSKADTIVNFHEYSNVGEFATVLVLDNYQVEEEGKYLLRLGSDDGYRIFVNGKEVASRIIGRALQLDSDWIPIHLNKGNNQLAIQVNQGTGDWKLHYRIDKGENLETLINDQLIEIYRDLPDLNILADTADVLTLNRDPRQNLDSLHTISFQWIQPKSGKVIPVGKYTASQAPEIISLPEEPEFPLLFSYGVYDSSDVALYSETIPVFSESSAKDYVQKAYKKLRSGQNGQQWIRGLELLFPGFLEQEEVRSYSTRIKTEFLWDALIQAGYEFSEIGGPRMTDINGLISRVYRPDVYNEQTVQVFGIKPQPEDRLAHYMESYHGYTHNSLRIRSSYARYFNMEMTFPFIQQYSESNNLEKVLTDYVSKLPASEVFHIIAWSNSVPLVLDVLGSHPLPVEQVALLGSFLGDNPTKRFSIIQKIKKQNPNITWHIWHGEEDERVPISVMEDWVEAFKQQGFTVRYERLPLTDHEVYFTDPRKKFYRFITSE